MSPNDPNQEEALRDKKRRNSGREMDPRIPVRPLAEVSTVLRRRTMA